MLKEIGEKCKRNFIMCIIFFIVGCLNILFNYEMCRFFQLANIMVGFIPFLVTIFLLILFYKKDIKGIMRMVINIIFIILSVILLTFNFGKLMISEIFDINTNVKNYPRLIRLYDYKEEIKHFPSQIPKEAVNVEFEEWAPFMQGGSGMYLSYDIDEENEGRIDKEFREKSKYVFESIEDIDGAGENICINSKMSEAIGHNLSTENSDSFIMYILGATKISGEGYWNHGIIYGVIINKDKDKVIYFEEYW